MDKVGGGLRGSERCRGYGVGVGLGDRRKNKPCDGELSHGW